MSTKDLRRQDQIQSPSTGVVKRRLSVFPVDDGEPAILRNENSVLKKKLSRYESKETQLKVKLTDCLLVESSREEEGLVAAGW